MFKKILRELKRGTLIKKIIFKIKVWFLLIRKINIKNPQLYLEKYYYYMNKDKIDLNNPQTFNEKTNWYKLNYKNDLMPICADKVRVHDYVKGCGLEHILVKRYGVYNNLKEIDLSILPDQFVIKNNSDSGGFYLCKDKSKFKKGAKYVYKRMKKDYSNVRLEWPYKHIEKKLLIEELIKTKDGKAPNDYKIFCFNGEPKIVFVVTDRAKHCYFDFFDLDWNHLDCYQGYNFNNPNTPKQPENLKEMLEYAKILSKPFPFVRVDFYNENGKVYFGELTFFHDAGNVPFYPKEADYKLGELFDITKIKKNT